MVQPIGEPVPYDAFRCGLSFADVAAELRNEAAQTFEREGRRMFWTRRTVLGRMRQHKLTAYRHFSEWHRPRAALPW